MRPRPTTRTVRRRTYVVTANTSIDAARYVRRRAASDGARSCKIRRVRFDPTGSPLIGSPLQVDPRPPFRFLVTVDCVYRTRHR